MREKHTNTHAHPHTGSGGEREADRQRQRQRQTKTQPQTKQRGGSNHSQAAHLLVTGPHGKLRGKVWFDPERCDRVRR